MDPIDPPPPRVTTLADIFVQCGFVGPILVFATVTLTVWSLILLFKTRSVAYYYAFIAASLWPLLLGILGTTWAFMGALGALSERGIANPYYFFYGRFSEVLTPLLFGSFLTCLFFPIGIALLVFRRPK